MLGWPPPLKFYTCKCSISAYTDEAKQGYTDLASELGDTEGLSETSPLVDVGLEVLELDVIPVEGHLIDVAVTAALV